MSKLLTTDGRALECAGCNTLRLDMPFSPRVIADYLESKGLAHLPDCVFAADAYPRNTGREGTEAEWKEVANTWDRVVSIFKGLWR